MRRTVLEDGGVGAIQVFDEPVSHGQLAAIVLQPDPRQQHVRGGVSSGFHALLEHFGERRRESPVDRSRAP